MNDKIYTEAIKMAQTTFGKEPTELQILYGYAKLISLKDGVIRAIFQDPKDRETIQAIRDIFQENHINVDTLKNVGDDLFAYDTEKDKHVALAKSLLDELTAKNSDSISVPLIQAILSEESTALQMVKDGTDIRDCYSYIREQKQKFIENYHPEQSEHAEDPKESTASDDRPPADSVSSVSLTDKFASLTDDAMLLYKSLISKVKGQNEAVLTFVRGYFESQVVHEAERKSRNKPAAVFLFAGPPGVGKTMLSRTAARLLKLNPIEISVPEVTEKEFRAMLDSVQENPRSLVFFDEIEKSAPAFQSLFLQLLDGGTLYDVDFRDTILIFTTNAGESLYESHDRKNLASLPSSVVINALKGDKDGDGDRNRGTTLSAPLVSRFAGENLIMFNYLGSHEMIEIANDVFADTSANVRTTYNVDLMIDREVAPLLLFSESNNTDARNISSKSDHLIKDQLYEFARHVKDRSSLDSVRQIHMSVDLSSEDPEIRNLFINPEKKSFLYIGNEHDFDNVHLSSNVQLFAADNYSKAIDVLSNEEINFILIDLSFGVRKENEFLSLDDLDSDGIDIFESIHDKLPTMDIYILEKEAISDSDKMNFYERDVRGFLKAADPIALADRIETICDESYMQAQTEKLSGEHKVLSYNTSQKFSDDGSVVEIAFYDLKKKMITSSEENQQMVNEAERPTEKFDDVIGAEKAKDELRFFINYLKDPKSFMKMNIQPPKGILLYGPPGTGKTMLARAMAGETDIAFIPKTASEFKNQFVGNSEKNIRDAFALARKFAPSILFIDEIDAIGMRRTGSETNRHDENMLKQFLTEMDGFNVNYQKPVFVIAATNAGVNNEPNSLDPALVRRFDNKIYVGSLTEEDRKKYITLLLDKISVDHDDDMIESIARVSQGMQPANIKNVISLVRRQAVMKGREIDKKFILDMFDEYDNGESRKFSDEAMLLTARHEAGHAYLGYLAGIHIPYVTIVSRGDYGGYTKFDFGKDNIGFNRDELLSHIRMSLGGRAAELEFYGKRKGLTTGPSGDLQSATNAAMSLICTYGMNSDNLVALDYRDVLQSPLAEKLITDANTLLSEQLEEAKKLVHEGRDKIEALAEFLVENDQATQKDIDRIFA